MKDKAISILSTRPLDGSLIEKAAFQQIKIDTIAFINVQKLISNEVAMRINLMATEKANVVFTSMNAVEIVVEQLHITPLMPDWKIYCMGGATFTLVKKFWPFDSVVATAKDAVELAQKIADDKLSKVHFFCGNKRREELPVLLERQNIQVEELIVYETIETAAPVNIFYDAVLFFSPSAVNSFFSKNQLSAETIVFSIGNTTAKTIKQFVKNRIIVSDFPAKDQLVDKALKFFSERAIGKNK